MKSAVTITVLFTIVTLLGVLRKKYMEENKTIKAPFSCTKILTRDQCNEIPGCFWNERLYNCYRDD